MYFYGNGQTCCPNQTASCYYPTNCSNNHYAIVLVLFILLVIVLGSRMGN